LVDYEGLQVCKHTHGELGLAAAAGHHVVLTLPNGVEGHQQTAHLIEHDVLMEPIPIASGPRWGPIEAPGLGVEIDEDAVAEGAGGAAAAMHVDVSSPEFVQRVVEDTVARFGRIDVLYHCAADVHFVNTQDKRVTELDDAVWQRMIDLHLTGTFYVLKHVGKQ